MCSAMVTILSARVQHCGFEEAASHPQLGIRSRHKCAQLAQVVGCRRPHRDLCHAPIPGRRAWGCTRPTLPLGPHGGGVAWPVRQLTWLFRRPPIEWEGVGSDGPERIGHDGSTRRRSGWWHGDAPSLVGVPARGEAGHERDAGRKGGPGHRWWIRDRPRQMLWRLRGKAATWSTSSRHRAGQSVPPTACPSTPSSASQ